MKFAILHLSDIHFRDEGNVIIDRLDKIVNAIKNTIICIEELFVVVSGDIAFSGSDIQYQEAEFFINYLKHELESYSKSLRVKIILAPGNHDCDFSQNPRMRNEFISKLKSRKEVTDEDIDECTISQNQFFKFLDKYPPTYRNKLFYIYEFNNCSFIVYNTAWMSVLDEIQGTAVFPSHILNEVRKKFDENTIFFQVFHHPSHWLEQESKRLFDSTIASFPGFVFLGHEHTPDAYLKSDIEQIMSNAFIHGDVLQDSEDLAKSGFNLLIYDDETNKHNFHKYNLNQQQSLYLESDACKVIDRTFNEHRVISFTEEYERKINDLGFLCTHPRKTELSLVDLYIFPDLQESVKNNALDNKDTIRMNSAILATNVKDYPCVIIFGEEISGKTTLLYQLQKKYNDMSMVSIHLNAVNITNKFLNPDTLRSEIDKCFISQYGNKKISIFQQMNKSEKIILIDDFDKINFHYEDNGDEIIKLTKFINILLEYSTNIILISNDSFEVKVYTTEIKQILSNFKSFNVLEFGHLLIDKLIDKWLRINTSTINQKQDSLVEEKNEIRHVLTKVSHGNLLPRYPIYIINLLQAHEAGRENIKGNGFAYLYESLITRAFGLSSIKDSKKDILGSYLSELAYYCFTQNKYSISEVDIEKFNQTFSADKGINSLTILDIDLLIKGRLLNRDSGSFISFTQHYVYYYYLAKYIVEYFDDDEYGITIKNLVNDIVKRIYILEFANIIIFIVHHSPNKKNILNLIMKQANQLFLELNPTELKDSEFTTLSKSISSNILMVLNDKPKEQKHLESLHEQDYLDDINRKSLTNQHSDSQLMREEVRELDVISKINLAFKLMEILGLIAKNNASLKRTMKDQVITEVFDLGLRSITALLKELNDNHDSLVKDVEELIQRKNLKISSDSSKIEENAKKIIGSLAIAFAGLFIHKIVVSIASKELNLIFKEICTNKNDIAHKLIFLAINLEFPSGLDVERILEFNKELKSDLIAENLLRLFTRNHLYKYDVDRSKSDRLLSELNIGKKSMLLKKNKQKTI